MLHETDLCAGDGLCGRACCSPGPRRLSCQALDPPRQVAPHGLHQHGLQLPLQRGACAATGALPASSAALCGPFPRSHNHSRSRYKGCGTGGVTKGTARRCGGVVMPTMATMATLTTVATDVWVVATMPAIPATTTVATMTRPAGSGALISWLVSACRWVDWLIGQPVVWLVDWLVGRSGGRLAGRLVGGSVGGWAGWLARWSGWSVGRVVGLGASSPCFNA